MDETLVEAAVDISGRPFLAWDVSFERPKIGEMDTELFEEFFRAFAMNALVTLHITRRAGRNAHHVAEACFKARRGRCAWQPSRSARRRRHPVDQGYALRFWTAHLRQGTAPVLVREGFSWGALCFGPFWLAVHRAWIPAALVLVATVLIIFLTTDGVSVALMSALTLLLGLSGHDLRRWSLDHRGFLLAQVSCGARRDGCAAATVGAPSGPEGPFPASNTG